MILVREGIRFLDDVPQRGLREALTRFAFAFTIKMVIAVVINCFAVALPIAGVIYYIRFLAEDR